MSNFWSRNWPFVVVPALIVLAVAIWLLVTGEGGGGDFDYRVGR